MIGVKEDRPVLVDGVAIRILEEGIRKKLQGEGGYSFEDSLEFVEAKYGRKTAGVLRSALDCATRRMRS